MISEYARRVAMVLGEDGADVQHRLNRGLPLTEATTRDAPSRVSEVQRDFLGKWNRAMGKWRSQVALIDEGKDPFSKGAAIKGSAADLRARALVELETAWGKLIERGMKDGYRIGHAVRTGQVPKTFSESFLGSVEKNRRFASRFARDLAAGVPAEKGRMGTAARSRLYANSIAGSYNHGVVSTLRGDAIIFWQLGATDHCTACPVLAVSGPYTRDTLPTLPRDGDTPCGMNCACYLEFADGQRIREPDRPAAQAATRRPGSAVRRATSPGPTPPPGLRRPTAQERRAMMDLEQRVNYARRKIAQTAGTPEQGRWVRERREASRLRREFLDQRKIWDPPKLDVGEVVRGKDISTADVRDLTRTRGIDGSTVNRATGGARSQAVDDARGAAQGVTGLSSPGAPTDMESLLIQAGAPPELFRVRAGEADGALDPQVVVINAVGFGGEAALDQHLAMIDVLGEQVYGIEVGPFGDEWVDLVLAVGSWISGPPAEVERFVADWQRGRRWKPALARWLP